MKKIKLRKCNVCLKIFKRVAHRIFEGMLGPIPVALHKKCYEKLLKDDELLLKDYND